VIGILGYAPPIEPVGTESDATLRCGPFSSAPAVSRANVGPKACDANDSGLFGNRAQPFAVCWLKFFLGVAEPI
jgi:hypothetical protein